MRDHAADADLIPSGDYRNARDRRRFYLDRGLRKQGRGSGSDIHGLVELPRDVIVLRPDHLFGDIPAIFVDSVAARAYAPERFTKDIGFLVDHDRFAEATTLLAEEGWKKKLDLVFPNASLGLAGEAWEKDGQQIDVITTNQAWANEAFKTPAYDQTGLRVIPLAYLVLMKLDSARGVDQGDLTRMLGRLDETEIDAIVKIVEKHAHDPQAAMTCDSMLLSVEWSGRLRSNACDRPRPSCTLWSGPLRAGTEEQIGPAFAGSLQGRVPTGARAVANLLPADVGRGRRRAPIEAQSR